MHGRHLLMGYKKIAASSKYVQKTIAFTSVTGATSIAMTVTNAPASGNTVIICIKDQVGYVASSISDPRSNTWHLITSPASSATASVYWAYMTTPLHVGDVVTVTMSGGGSNITATAYEYSTIANGVADTSATKQQNTSPTVVVGPTGTTTNTGDLLFTLMTTAAASETVTVPSGYTLRDSETVASCTMAVADYSPGTTGAFSATWGVNTNANLAAVLIAFLP